MRLSKAKLPRQKAQAQNLRWSRRMSARAMTCLGIVLSLSPVLALAQSSVPVPLYPGASPPRTYEQRTLPPAATAPSDSAAPEYRPPMPASPSAPEPPRPASPSPPAAAAAAPPANATASDRVFCTQPLSVRVTDRDAVPERYRPFIGIWSDASWTPQLCAALVVENIAPDGTATIVYAFGPMGSGGKASGGVLHGTGIIKDGELRFQNSDGSQYTFRPLYSDLDGKYTTPQGQTYGAVFKRTM
jgi:hypothetical protein